MVKILEIINEEFIAPNECLAVIFADSKEELSSEYSVSGLPTGRTLAPGCKFKTADGSEGYLKSDGTIEWPVEPSDLPPVDSSDNGKVLVVEDGQWAVGESPVTPEDIQQAVDNYCEENFSEWAGGLDSGLTQPLMAAPADKVGELKSALTTLNDCKKTVDVLLKADNPLTQNKRVNPETGKISNITNNRYFAISNNYVDISDFSDLYIEYNVTYTNKLYLSFFTAEKVLVGAVSEIDTVSGTKYNITVPETATFMNVGGYSMGDDKTASAISTTIVCGAISFFDGVLDTTLISDVLPPQSKKVGDELNKINQTLLDGGVYRTELIDVCTIHGSNGYIKLDVGIGNTVNTTPTTSSQWGHQITAVKKDDEFYITGHGGNASRLWGFTDAEYKLLTVEDAGAVGENTKIVAPDDGYLIMNTLVQDTVYGLTKKEVIYGITELRASSRMEFGAHEGAEAYAPSNSVAAYELAGKMGFQWAWLAQVRWSSEFTLYVSHDRLLGSIAEDSPGHRSEYNIEDCTDDYINSLRVVGYPRYNYDLSKFTESELKLVSLEKAIQICIKYGMNMCFRINNFAGHTVGDQETIWNNFITLIKAYNIKDAIYSGETAAECNVLKSFLGDDVNFCAYLGSSSTAQDYIDFFTNPDNIPKLSNKLSVLLSYNVATLADIKLLHSHGYDVYVFYNGTMPTPEEITTWATYGVEILQNPAVPRINL